MDKEVKSAILGGSFNPVHLGHIELAKEVLKYGYEKIVFVPACRPPHKLLAPGADHEQRLKMLHLALSDKEWACIWDGEIRRGGLSSTIDTVKILMEEKIINSKPGLIIGSDLLIGFHKWKKAEKLSRMCEIIVAKRQINKNKEESFNYPAVILDNLCWPQSSTEIRRQIRQNGDIESMLDPRVFSFIKRTGVYIV